MRLQVFHRTQYTYRIPVTGSYNEVRLRPVTQDRERLEFFLLNVQPPVRLQHFRDNYLNYVHYFELPEPHRELVIEAQSIVNTTSPYADGKPAGVEMSALHGLQDEMLRVYLDASQYVEHSPELWKLGLDLSNGCTGIFTIAENIRSHIYQNWTYAPNTTSAWTHVREVLESKSGVCQDYAHLMIGICRAIGIPARYVSGYLYSGRDAGLRGAQASHAWCEVFVPGRGWYGLDPTNDTLADDRHIKIATGRDYHDAAPVSGRYNGPPGATSALSVDLRIEELPH
jgi:transglutaminase-like putative cysteine protease